MMATRSHVCSISARMWLDTNTVRPSRAERSHSSRTSTMPAGSRPLAGSSRIEQLRVLQQRGRDAEPLLHAERVVPHAVVGALGEADASRTRRSRSRRCRRSRRGSRGSAGRERGTAPASRRSPRPGRYRRAAGAAVGAEQPHPPGVGRRGRGGTGSSSSCRRRSGRGSRRRRPRAPSRSSPSTATVRPPRRRRYSLWSPSISITFATFAPIAAKGCTRTDLALHVAMR